VYANLRQANHGGKWGRVSLGERGAERGNIAVRRAAVLRAAVFRAAG
jgi:hypothetical protein